MKLSPLGHYVAATVSLTAQESQIRETSVCGRHLVFKFALVA